MEDLFSQFILLSDQSLQDKFFNPSSIEDFMKLFELESYKAWAAAELDNEKEVQEAEESMKAAEDYLDSEIERKSKGEMKSLVQDGESARKAGKSMEKAATIASKKYVEAGLNSAGASMKSAWKGLSANANKVHPS
ncbi:hypothetical protein CsSME_00010162 [Camellia sinensis var. sinensis]